MLTSSLREAISYAVRKENGIFMPTMDLVGLANLLGWEHDGSFESIFLAGQASMARDKKGDMLKIRAMNKNEGNKYTDEMKETGRQLLDNKFGHLGNEFTFRPRRKWYRYLLVLSNWPADAFRRMQCTGTLLEQGVRFGEIVLPASAHDGPVEKSLSTLRDAGAFNPYSIGPADLCDLPTSEVASMRWLLKHVVPTRLLLDRKGKQIPITEVIARPIPTSDGKTKTANTRSSMSDWREAFGFGLEDAQRKAGDVLAISNGWQYPRGRVIVETELLSWNCGFNKFVIDTVGAGPGFNHPFEVLVAELNRYLYEVHDVLTKQA